MDQLSFFSAGVAAASVDDLGGILAGTGQVTFGGDGRRGARLSVLVTQRWRAEALVAEFAARDLEAQILDPQSSDARQDGGRADDGTPAGGLLVRSDHSESLLPLAARWTKGSVKRVPSLPVPPGGFLRCWALAAGRGVDAGFQLGLDPRSEHTHTRLASALAGIGLTGALLGVRAGGPAVRIVGRRKLGRLAELVGDEVPGSPPGAFPCAPSR